jgi:hypothetical protein
VTVLDYLNLITAAFRQQPNFTGTVSTDVELPVRVQEILLSMIPLFDVDRAVGEQLDIVGKWVGVSRNVAIPITGVYFSWDGDYTVGWDYGSWQPDLAPTSITSLPDDAYRTLIKSKIAANSWPGTTDTAYAIWDSLFPNVTILIQDNQDMSYDLAVVGGIVDSLTWALLTGGYIELKPEGVRVNAYYASIDDGPVFSWDLDSDLLKGWEEGSWVREFSPS